MRKWIMVIDAAKCEDCNNCLLACKDEHDGNDWPGYTLAQPRHGQRWMNILRVERGTYPMIDVAYRPTPCMHCDNAPCIKSAANGAVYKRSDGIVLIDPERAAGQKELVEACPYGAIYWNEEKSRPQKCTLCAHLLDDGWSKPRCVQSCPTGALEIHRVDDAERNRIVAREQLEVLHPDLNTNPRVYYKNLYRVSQCFIGGSVAVESDGILDCAEGATVTLSQGRQRIAEAVTDNYGDFKFDRLTGSKDGYTVAIELAGWKPHTLRVSELTASLYLGTLRLRPAEER